MLITKPSNISSVGFLLMVFLLSLAYANAQQPLPQKSTPASSELTDQLLAIAEEATTAQLQILVSGDIEGNLKNKRLAHLYRESMTSDFQFQVNRRNKLKETKQDYKDFKTNLTVIGASTDGNHAILKATESTRLKLDVPGGPEATEYSRDHSFEYVYDKNGWKLMKNEILRPEPAPIKDINKQPNV